MNRIIPLMLLLAPLLCAEPPTADTAQRTLFASQAPAQSSWTIQIKQKGNKKSPTEVPAGTAAQGGSMIGSQPWALDQIQVDKTGAIRRIQRKWKDGRSAESWWQGPLCLAETPTQEGGSQVMVINTSSGTGGFMDTSALSASLASGGDYKTTDFPELSWIQPEMRVDTVSEGEVQYHVYRSSPTSAVSSKPMVDPTLREPLEPAKSAAEGKVISSEQRAPAPVKEAWINAATKLPFRLIDGDSTWTYSFSRGSASLQLPASYGEALQKYKLAREAAKSRRLP